MSTATAPERSHAPYAEPDEYIDYQLRKTQTGIKRIDMLTSAIVAITVLIGYVLLFVLSDHWLFEGGVGGTARVLMFLPVIGFVGWLIGAKVIWPALRTVSGLYAARTLEASSTEFRSGLLNLVDLKQAGREVSPLILATMEKRAAVTLAKFNVDDAIDKRPLLRTLYVLFGIVVAFCLYSVLSPKKLGPSVLRAIVPFTNVTPATQTEIVEVKVTVGDKTMRADEDVKLRAGGILPVSVQLRGEVPADVTLLFTTADRRFVDEPMQLGATTDPQVFDGTLGNDEHGLLQSFTYHVVAGDARSPEYRVEIITPPSATVSEVRYDYPEYTELDPRTQMGGAIDVWERTGVTITAATNVPIKSAEFELSDTEDFSAAYPGASVKIADGKKLTISWRADPRQTDGKFPKFYRIKVKDAGGTPDPKPAVYPINVRVDQPPQVVLIDPTTNLELPANGTVPLVVAARDQDFKLRTVSLKIARDENDVTDETLFDGSQQEVVLKHDFQLEPLRLKEGDKIRIWVEAQDNRLPTHNLSKTSAIEITIKGKVTKEEAKKQLEEQKKEQQQRLDEAAKNNDQPNDPTPSDPANSPDQPPRDPNEREQPKDQNDEANKDQPQQKGQQQDDKNSKGKEGGSGKTQKGGEGKKSETGSEGKSDKPGEKGIAADGKSSKPSLKSDGTQDQEALEKIVWDAKQRGELPKKSEPQTSPSSAQREPQENSNGESADKPMPNSSSKPNPQGDPKANDGSKPPQPNRGQQPKADKNDDADPKSPNDPDDPQPSDKPNATEKGTDPKSGNDPKQDKPKNGNDPKKADGSKEPKGKSPKEGDEPKPGDNDPKKPDGDGKKTDPNDPKSTNKPNGKKGDDKNADGGNKPMPKNGPGEKNDPSASEDKAGGEKPGSKPDAQKPAPTDKPGNDQKQSQPDGSGKPDSQKPKGLGKPETDDKQRSPDGAKSDKPSNDDKSAKPKDQEGRSDKPDSKKSNDPSGKGADDKDPKSPDKQPDSDKNEDSKPGDKGAEKADSSKKPRRGQQGDKSKDPSNDKGEDNKSPSDKSGDDKVGQPKDGDKGDSGQSKKEGSPKSDKGGQKPGGKEGQPKPGNKEGGSESSDSDSNSKGPAKPGSQGSKKGGKAGSASGGGTPSQPGDPSASNNPSGSGSSSGAPEEANEEFTKEAANLVLKRLQKDLDRGEVDQELLDELGWTPEQMKKFVDRMQQQLEAKPDDDAPQAKAKQRQFEEMLKNLNLTEKTQRRDDTNKDKQTGDGIGPVRRPPPPEYREAFERYTKSLSKKKTVEAPKK